MYNLGVIMFGSVQLPIVDLMQNSVNQ